MTNDGEWMQRLDGYANGRATKHEIVEIAAEHFARDGFHGASLRGIARAAGIDHSTLIHHFGTKAGLLIEVLAWQDARHVPATMPTDITPELIADGFLATAMRNREAPGLVRLLSVMSAEAGDETHPARPFLLQRHAALTEIIASMIDRQRASGAVKDDGAPSRVGAAVVIATWEGLQVYDALHPGELDVPDLVGRTFRTAFGLPVAG